MVDYLLNLAGVDPVENWNNLMYYFLILFSFLGTFLMTSRLMNKLPRDGGRAFAVNGQLSQGKPRGAGIIFILCFAINTLLFAKLDLELIIYVVMIVCAMFSGYFDDASETPWNEYKKGIIDFLIAVITAVTYIYFNGSDITISVADATFKLNPIVYGVLAVILIWASINVINCTDGVDGLCATLSIITLAAFIVVFKFIGLDKNYIFITGGFILCLLAYLWFNSSPSIILMGDAGSRAIGIFVAILSLKSGRPLLFIPLALVFIIDGGLGLIKISLKRFLKISILKNTRTPIHDHMRKNKGWSDTQTVLRFCILSALEIALFIYIAFLL